MGNKLPTSNWRAGFQPTTVANHCRNTVKQLCNQKNISISSHLFPEPADYEQAPAKFGCKSGWTMFISFISNIFLHHQPPVCKILQCSSRSFLHPIWEVPGNLDETVRSQQCNHRKAQGLGIAWGVIHQQHQKKHRKCWTLKWLNGNVAIFVWVNTSLQLMLCAPGRHRQENWACHNFPASSTKITKPMHHQPAASANRQTSDFQSNAEVLGFSEDLPELWL